MSLPKSEEMMEALKSVEDPELHIDLVNLGLIYNIEKNEEKGHVDIKMGVTSPGCPYLGELQRQVHDTVAGMEGVKSVQVEVSFTPPWDPRTMASDEAKDILGIF